MSSHLVTAEHVHEENLRYIDVTLCSNSKYIHVHVYCIQVQQHTSFFYMYHNRYSELLYEVTSLPYPQNVVPSDVYTLPPECGAQ